MATSNEASSRDLLSLVLRSRKALDHTKTLCSRADTLSKDSTQLALDLVGVDAKVRWATEMILEQLKVISLSSHYYDNKLTSWARIFSSLVGSPNLLRDSVVSSNKMPMYVSKIAMMYKSD